MLALRAGGDDAARRALGACPETFMGLTSVGDLFATAASRLSRNYRLGYAVAQGKTPQQALREAGQVAEELLHRVRGAEAGAPTPGLTPLC